ncbi:MAG TPA: ABC transporter permease [Thermoanaerobaculia bacterium]|jgi:putative ABC transport system permease protein|nr:ABC transporter permease [Thermoanaerobaculia bacterium]
MTRLRGARGIGALDALRFSLRALLAHRLRSSLSLLGMSIGVAAVVILTALGEGARRYVVREFAGIGTNLLLVLPGKTETAGALPGIGGVPHDLTLDDAAAVARLRGVRRVAPLASGTETVAHLQRRRQVAVMGATAEMALVRRLEIAHGRFLPPGEARRGSPVVVIGQGVARELFPGEDPLGKAIRVGGERMKVIGVLAHRGVQLGVDMDEVAIVPVATGMRLFDRSGLFRLLIEANNRRDLPALQPRVVALLAARHGEEDVTVVTQQAVLSSFDRILRALTLAVGAIAAISLGVAGLLIMNVMLVSVSERTSEVGLLKALGAEGGQVQLVFLLEAALLSALGALAGLALGWAGVALLLHLFPKLPATAPPWAQAASVITALGSGLLFGVLPARRASRLEPVAALARR